MARVTTRSERQTRARSGRRYNLLAGRLHAVEWDALTPRRIPNEELHDTLVSAFKDTEGYRQDTREGEEKPTWVLGDFRERRAADEWLVFGRLGKLRPGSEQKGFNWSTREFVRAPVDQETATGWADFILDLQSRVVLYEDRPPHVSGSQFRQYFPKVYQTRVKGFYEVEVTQISSTEEIYAFIETLDRLNVVSAEVTPSNPKATKEFEAFAKNLERAKVEAATVILRSREGLNTVDTLASEVIALAAVGYGKVSLQGERSGVTVNLQSKSRVVHEVVSKTPDDPDRLLEIFGTRLGAVIRRLGKK